MKGRYGAATTFIKRNVQNVCTQGPALKMTNTIFLEMFAQILPGICNKPVVNTKSTQTRPCLSIREVI